MSIHPKRGAKVRRGGEAAPEVVIVGAGPTGLALAIELGMRSVHCLVVERNERVGYAPRAKTTHVRTREIMRRWGIADKLAEASPFGVHYPSDVHFVTRLSGPRLVRFENAMRCAPGRDPLYSEHGQWIPQYKLEAVLKAHADTLDSVTIEFGAEFVSMEQDEHGIEVRVRSLESGEERVVGTSYLVGADGARSPVRDSIGAKMEGTYGLSRNYNIIFQAPGLAEAHPHGPGSMYWNVNRDVPSVIGPMDRDDIWYFMPTMLPVNVTLTNDEARALIAKATGIDLPYRVLSSDEWVASRLIADRYRLGRAFLAGDACHLHPPFGGFGMNMGVADALDLGWKIAAVAQGWGGPALLDSYEAERRPVHQLVIDEAEANHSVLANQLYRDGIEDLTAEGEAVRLEVGALIRATKAREFYALGVVLGLRYTNSPVIVPDGTEPTWRMSRDYLPSAAPGSLAPHAWLPDGRSLYDLFGDGFTLLVFGQSDGADIGVAEAEAGRTGTPLTVVKLADASLAELYDASRALVRPDQVVAWRGDEWPQDGLLAFASGRSARAPVEASREPASA